MRWLALLFRIIGWLLTPFVVWAASFFGAWVGAGMFGDVSAPRDALYFAAIAGCISGLITTFIWLRFLRRSPRLRHSLHVTREGLPLLEEALEEALPTPEPEAPAQSANPSASAPSADAPG